MHGGPNKRGCTPIGAANSALIMGRGKKQKSYNDDDDSLAGRTRSNHHMPPEPVKMTRSGANLIDDLLKDPMEDQEVVEEERGRRMPSYHGSLKKDDSRSRSGERLGSEKGTSGGHLYSPGRMPSSKRSRENSLNRMPSNGRLTNSLSTGVNQHASSSFNDSHYHYGSRADLSNQPSLGNSGGRLTTSRMTEQEQGYYREREMMEDPWGRKRSRRSTVELEDQSKDAVLKRKADKVWGRSAWHPISILDWLMSRKVLLFSILGILLVGLLVAGLLTFFLWPRPVSISFVEIQHDTNPKPYRVVPREGGIHLRVHSWLSVDVLNPNYFGAKVKKSQVIANWRRLDGSLEMFGGSIIDAEVLLKKRERKRLRLPVTIEYMGTPESDPIYWDFLERCYVEPGDKGGQIGMNWEVQVVTAAKGVERTGLISIDRSMACPIGRDMIEESLRGLQIDPKALLKRKAPRK